MFSPHHFQKCLLNWFDLSGRKDLPWQQNKTPYRVWISEIMLQQTQVSTVIQYFDRFMKAFPDIHDLASAHEDQVLHLWAGLGYYSRGRNCHRTAKLIVEKYDGQFPNQAEILIGLPGIGPSTAGAIQAIAFNQPAAILDGNVKRVLARFHGIYQPINERETEKKLWDLAISYTPCARASDYTQAIMDLGAMVCIRGKPKCESCPLGPNCVAYKEGKAEHYPIKNRARPLPYRKATFLVIKKKAHILLQKRQAKGIWAKLWCLPELDGQASTQKALAYCKEQFKLAGKEVKQVKALPHFRHTFTHYHLDIYPIIVECESAKIVEDDQQIWYNLYHPQSIGLPRPIQLIVSTLI
jgi:A/G-specific adenine glycosylase